MSKLDSSCLTANRHLPGPPFTLSDRLLPQQALSQVLNVDPFMALALEPRIMFDAAGLATSGTVSIDDATTEDVQILSADSVEAQIDSAKQTERMDTLSAALAAPATEVNDTSSESRSVLFIDASLSAEERSALVSSIAPDAEVFLIEDDSDGVQQISAVLEQYDHELDSIYIVSHGSEGQIELGQAVLESGTLNSYAEQLGSWSNALSDDADILFYACDVAGNESGIALLDSIAELTGADVAASVDDTGTDSNWQLEYSTGSIQATMTDSVLGYVGLLETINVTTASDVIDAGDGVTSFREAIIQANESVTDTTIDVGSFGASIGLVGTLENASLTGDFDITKTTGTLTITGIDSASSVISGSSLDRVLHIHSGANVIIENIAIAEGTANDDGFSSDSGRGAGILVESGATVTLNNVLLSYNSAAGLGGTGGAGGTVAGEPGGDGSAGGSAFGGGIYNAGTLTVSTSTFTSNSALAGGGGGGGASAETNGLSGVPGSGGAGGNASGGAIYSAGTLSLGAGNSFSGNTVYAGGGGGAGQFGGSQVPGDGGSGNDGGFFEGFGGTGGDSSLAQSDGLFAGLGGYPGEVGEDTPGVDPGIGGLGGAGGVAESPDVFEQPVLDNTAPVISSGASSMFPENGIGAAHTVIASDDIGVTGYSLSGVDADKLSVDSSGNITFNVDPDFENPGSAAATNDYVVTVHVVDAAANETTQQITISVMVRDSDAPLINSGTSSDFPENGIGAAHTMIVSDDSPVTYSLNSVDADKFSIDDAGNITFNVAPDFENPGSDAGTNEYRVTVRVTDKADNEVTQQITINVLAADEVAPVINSEASSNFAENASGTAHTVIVSDDSVVTYSLNGVDADKLTIDDVGNITFKVAPDFDNPGSAAGTNEYVVTVHVVDKAGNETTQGITITVIAADTVDDSPPQISDVGFKLGTFDFDGDTFTEPAFILSFLISDVDTPLNQLTVEVNEEDAQITIADDGRVTIALEASRSDFNLVIVVSDGLNSTVAELFIDVTTKEDKDYDDEYKLGDTSGLGVGETKVLSSEEATALSADLTSSTPAMTPINPDGEIQTVDLGSVDVTFEDEDSSALGIVEVMTALGLAGTALWSRWGKRLSRSIFSQ
jgi:uncharacterized protein DUF4347